MQIVSTTIKGTNIHGGNFFINNIPNDREISSVFYNGDFLKPIIVDDVWIEGATLEEIADNELKKQMIAAKQFIDNNKAAGKNFYDDIHLRVTVALFAVERNILFPILQEVDTKLYPPLEKIKTGDFASALFIFTNQAPPTNEFVLEFYNEAIQYCQNYYDTKYPK